MLTVFPGVGPADGGRVDPPSSAGGREGVREALALVGDGLGAATRRDGGHGRVRGGRAGDHERHEVKAHLRRERFSGDGGG